MSSSRESLQFANISATTAAFVLKGGRYALQVIATWGGGSVTLQRMANDSSTYVTVLAPFATNGYATIDLPVGTYKLTVATATGIYADIQSIAVPV